MELQRLSIAVNEVQDRVRYRLASGEAVPKVVWADEGDELLLHLDSLRCACTDGWLVCELLVEAAGVGRQRLHCVYFLGHDEQADGTRAAASIRAAKPEGEAITDRWGRALLRVAWDGVLDVIEGAVAHATTRSRGTLVGYGCANARLHVDMGVG